MLKKQKCSNRKKCVIIVAIMFFLLFLVEEYLRSKYGLKVTEYEVNAGAGAGVGKAETVRIVQLTDLHNSRFGRGNGRLIKSIQKQQPDLILMTGDMLNMDESKTDIAVDLIEELVKMAPVYVSYGNHEVGYESSYGIDLTVLFEAAGAHVVDCSYEDLEVKGQKLRIGGVYGYAQASGSGDPTSENVEFLKKFEKTDRYRILLCHIPSGWSRWNNLEDWDIDLTFCGHVHGGQVQIPILGSLYAPEEGWFPGRESGCFFSEDGSREMILSTGLGSTEWVPRLNNVPEIVVADLEFK